MSRVRVKVCGITRAIDAEIAIACGADAVGFVFWPSSPRAISTRDAAEIAEGWPGLVARVGVFVNARPEDIAEVVREVGLSAVQLHGDEDVAQYRSLPVPIVKAVALENDADVQRALALPADVTPLVDAVDLVHRGGTGRVASWILAHAVASVRPVMLAGGLTAANVGDAIRAVTPWAVDVSSGVEASPGVKDRARIEAFFAAVALASRVA